MKIRLFVRFCILLISLSLPVLLLAQGDPGDDPDPGVDIPFDGGLSLLIAAGIGYAAKKGYDKRKKEKGIAKEEK